MELKVKPTNTRKGFTLIELLVVVAIIALLVSILVPALSQAHGQAQAVVCKSRLKQVGLVMLMYAEDNGGWAPYNYDSITPTWHTWAGTLDVSGYLRELNADRNTVMMCPSQKPYRFEDRTLISWRESFTYGMRSGWGHAAFNILRSPVIDSIHRGAIKWGPPLSFLFIGDSVLEYPPDLGHRWQPATVHKRSVSC